ncbi:hypothetical protein GF366_02170 [Candidatus Peregrinibacteria bacterium]|nr:hypothetical protein [Candidatus Peregrinibacteria bacterium]
MYINKEYSEADYEKLSKQIIQHMQKTVEWGEHFPMEISSFDYEITIANEYFPIKKPKFLEKKWENSEISGAKICITCQKPYKIIPQEKRFYDSLELPNTKECQNCRHLKRLNLRNPRQLFDRNCSKCKISFKTSYPQDLPYKVYCEKRSLEEVY